MKKPEKQKIRLLKASSTTPRKSMFTKLINYKKMNVYKHGKQSMLTRILNIENRNVDKVDKLYRVCEIFSWIFSAWKKPIKENK